MSIDLTIRSGTTRTYPQKGDSGLHDQATSWAQDVTTALNASPQYSEIGPFDAVIGSAADVAAGTATHTTFATAIAAVSANDRIFVRENTYEPASIIDINKALTIIGQGEGAIVEGDNIATGAVVKINATGVTLENIKIIQGSGTPDYALEIAAAKERIYLNIKADGTFATSLYLNGTVAGALTGFITYDTNSVAFLGESQIVEQLKLEDQTTPAYNLVLQSDSDTDVLTADRILTFDVHDGARTIDLQENITFADGYDFTFTAEDSATAIVFDNANFEVESSDASQRDFKITSAKAGNTLLTFEENFSIGDGYDVTITAEDAASSITLDNCSLEVEDAIGSGNTVKFVIGTDDASRTVTLSENLVIGDGYDVTLISEDTANTITLDKQNFEVEGEGTAQQLVKLVNASNAAATLTIDGTNAVVDQDVTAASSPAFTSAALTTPVLTTSVSGTAVLDEDNMVSDSATQVATQQSIKSYVDGSVAAGGHKQPDLLSDIGIKITMAANAATIAITRSDGSTDATAGNPVKVGFRDSTITTGGYNIQTLSAALSTVIPSGATGATTNGDPHRIYIYALDNAGTIEAFWSKKLFSAENELITTTTSGAGSDDADTAYSTTGRTDVPFTLVGHFISTQATAGTWVTAASEIYVGKNQKQENGYSAVYSTNAGQSIDTATITVVNFEDVGYDPESMVSVGAAWKYEIKEYGMYRVNAAILFTPNTVGGRWIFVRKNGSNITEVLSEHAVTAGDYTTQPTNHLIKCNPGDYLDIAVQQTSGGALTLLASNAQNFISVIKEG